MTTGKSNRAVVKEEAFTVVSFILCDDVRKKK